MKENKTIDRKSVILVDENDKAIGIASKEEAHKRPLLHRAFSIFLYDGDKMLLQQRAFHKYHSGGLWANACCSHPGDNLCITRDAEERLYAETGIECGVQEIFSFVYNYQFNVDLFEHEYDHVMIGEYKNGQKSEIKPNPDEVASIRWVSFTQLQKELKETPEKFAPWFNIAAPKVIEYLTQKED
ncbi:MAG: isopentenyl-diphosphate Delta-isomerase [Aminipila sp.]